MSCDPMSMNEFIQKLLQILQEEKVFDDDLRVLSFLQPENLKEKMDLSLDNPCSEAELLTLFRDAVKYSVKTGSPYFMNQLYGGVDKYGLSGAVLSEALNTSQYTFEVAPVFSLCEMEVIRKCLELVGFQEGDGIFSPGGSLSNMYGIVLARYKKCPNVKRVGLCSQAPLVLFTSQGSHYSMKKGAHWLGIGTDNVVAVETDRFDRIIPQKLDLAIQEAITSGKTPLMVNATAGTTVLGSFDPLNEVADICKKHGVWMHVDACLGGSLLFSKTHSIRLNGIHRADSVSWNPHKMLGAPLQASILLVKHKGLLKECNMAGATYLFQQDKMYDVQYDSGDKSVQCGRKVDAFKFWAMWKARGSAGIGELVDAALTTANYFLAQIRNRPEFKLVNEKFETSNICFWYIPKRLRGMPETEEWWDEVGKVAPALKRHFIEDGSLMIGYQPLPHKNLRNFFRLVVTCHPPRSQSHIDRVIELFVKFGEEL